MPIGRITAEEERRLRAFMAMPSADLHGFRSNPAEELYGYGPTVAESYYSEQVAAENGRQWSANPNSVAYQVRTGQIRGLSPRMLDPDYRSSSASRSAFHSARSHLRSYRDVRY